MRVIYLHGFSSSPNSSKARFFGEKFAGRAEYSAPDLTEGDFTNSTLSQQLAFLNRHVGGNPGDSPAILMGSSMGGYLAALFAARYPQRVPKLILMAPAFGLAARWSQLLGPDVISAWERDGVRDFYHWGLKQHLPVSYELVRDGLQYEEFPNVHCPTLAMHGRHDDAVDYRLSERFAAGRKNVELVIYESDHQLLDVVDDMWERVRSFLFTA